MIVKNAAIRVVGDKVNWVSRTPSSTLLDGKTELVLALRNPWTLVSKFDLTCILDKEWAKEFMKKANPKQYHLCSVTSTIVKNAK